LALILLGLIGYNVYDFTCITLRNQSQNVVRSYYDALDFKYYEKAHSYIDPNSKLSISQFMLETCSGRHLEFYAKLDAIDVQILKAKQS
jgi:hypothetical protein